MDELWQDLRWAVRCLLKTPAYSLVAVTTLTLGVGATTSIYTVIQSVLLEPMPFPEPQNIVVIQEANPEAGFPRFAVSPLNFRDFRAMSRSFEFMAARTRTNLALSRGDGAQVLRLSGQAVTHDFLKVYRTPPAMGRDFTPEDDQPGAPPVILLGHSTWQSLGSDPQIVGKDLRVDGEPTRVIGVLPENHPQTTEALVPLRVDYEDSGRGGHWLIVFGRLNSGVSVTQARADLERIAANLAETYPESNTGWTALVDPLHERVVENIRTALWMLFAAVGLVLLIACANVANLTLARHASRAREVALRMSLGAGRFRLLRQMLTEGLIIALVSTSIGLFVAARGTAWLVAASGDDLPRASSIAVDGGVLAFALAAAFVATFLFGFLPAIQASRPDLAGTLKQGGRGGAGAAEGRRLRSALVLGEVALALVLLVGAGLLVKSFATLVGVDPGFDPDHVWTASLSLPDTTYDDEHTRITFFRRLIEEAAAVPGVEHVGTVFPMPLSGADWVNSTYLEGEPIPPPNQERNVNVRFASAGYFAALGIPLVRGRTLELTDDDQATPVIVVNQSAVQAFWPDEEPIGKRITFGRPNGDDPRWYTVVGTVGDVHHNSLDSPVQPAFYRSVLQDAPSDAVLVVRMRNDPRAAAQPVRDLIHRLDPDLPLSAEQTGGELVSESVAGSRFSMTLLTLFAGLALLLAAIGVFGVVSQVMSQRLREVGVRLALGARAIQIVRMVVGQGMRPVLGGIVLGLAGALAAARLLKSLVYGVTTTDPTTYVAVGSLLAAVAALACLGPALRALRVDPVEVLRDE